jgi:hypothetical protein
VAHDVLALLAEAAKQPHIPAAFRQRITVEAQQEVAVDLLREAELKRALAALASAGVQAVVMKGSHLAYTHFARPDLRSRLDSDLLIPPSARDTVHELFTQTLGYTAATQPTGELTGAQQTYRCAVRAGYVHQFDVHWRFTNASAFAHALSYDEIRANAVAVPALGPSALAPCNVHALVIACIHRIAHHDDDEELKWFVDIDRLATRFTPDEWERFITHVVDRRIAGVCMHSLRRAIELLRTPVPDVVLGDPRLRAKGETLAATYLRKSSQAEMLAADLRSLPTWRERTRLLREHLFPSEEYMRRRYAPGSRAPLAWLYAVRIARGAVPWLRSRR